MNPQNATCSHCLTLARVDLLEPSSDPWKQIASELLRQR